MELKRFNALHVANPLADTSGVYDARAQQILNLAAFAEARDEIVTWPGYAPTPLVALPGLASALSLKAVHFKEEGKRFGLKSFKALGGAYAVLRILQQHLRKAGGLDGISSRELISGKYAQITKTVTVVSATDGNHGRSVAWGASLFGCACKIYLHAHVSTRREQEIAKYGAEIVRTAGGYDDCVRRCAEDAATNGWQLVADTTAGGGDDWAPMRVMQGYTILAQEFLDQLPEGPPSHVFVPGGVGGIAAAVAAQLRERLGRDCPRIIAVEPTRANCIFRSISAGELSAVPGEVSTFMACLAAGEVSPLAWPVLRGCIDDVVSLPDEASPDTMRLLAYGVAGDPPLVAGESGAAATGGLVASALDGNLRAALGLNETSVVVAIGSEGATDAETYEQVVGKPAEEIGRAA